MRRKQITSIVLSLVLASSAFCSPFAQVPAYAAEEAAEAVEAAEAENAAKAAEAAKDAETAEAAEVTEETAAEDVNTAVSGEAVNDEAETGISGEEAGDAEAEVNDEVNDEGVPQDYQQNADTSESTEEAIEEAVPIQDETNSESKDGNVGDSIFEGTVSVTTKDQKTIPETGDGKSSEDLFAEYVDRSFGVQNGQPGQAPSGRKRAPKSAASSLNGIDRVIYDEIAACLPAIAAGERESTVFEIDVDELGLEQMFWTATELGVFSIFTLDENGNIIVDDEGNASISEEAIAALEIFTAYDLSKILSALRADNPYRLYWYEKTKETTASGYELSAFYDDMVGDYVLGIVDSFTISFPVAEEFSAGEYMVDVSIGQAVQASVENANEIVEKYAYADDCVKLSSYQEEICSLVSYNYEAADGGISYGNPWQLIWVFDEDPSTNVVCEGYAKAFKYLCDQSDFSGDISCITVTGTMDGGTGEGPHMWNIVNMEDGRNYLVDLTNTDEGTSGQNGELFLTAYISGDVESGYTFLCSGDTDINYVYDVEMFDIYSIEDLTISAITYGTTITVHPQDVSAAVGEVVHLHVKASRSDVIYQWQWSGDGTTWKNCTSGGYNTDTFEFTMKATLAGRRYRCYVRRDYENIFSGEALISLKPVSIIRDPEDVQARIGERVEFSVDAKGNNLKYQWQWSSNGETWKNCTSGGYNTAVFSFNMKESLSGRLYRCKVTGGGVTLTSETATITLINSIEITRQPEDVNAEVGENVVFTVEVQGEDPSYQWQWSTDGTTWKNCTSGGCKTSTFSFNMKESLSGRLYRCKVSGGGQSIVSDAAVITLFRLEITYQPQAVSCKTGETVNLKVETNKSNVTYQWQWKTDSTNWKNCTSEGYNTDTFSFLMKKTMEGRYYRCRVSDGYDTIYSDTAQIFFALQSGECGDDVRWALDRNGVLIISGEGPMFDYNSVESPFCFNEEVKSVVINSGVTRVGNFAFQEGWEIEEATLPAGLTSIGDYAFSGCKTLTHISIPDSVKSIGEYAFSYCVVLENIDLPAQMESISEYMFARCNSLTTIHIPGGVERIAPHAFSECTSLDNVVVPGSVRIVAEKAFESCSNLKNIIISNGVLGIDQGAFRDCISLQSISIPQSTQLPVIGTSPFYNCSSLEEIIVDENNPYYLSCEGVLFTKDQGAILRYPPAKTDESYTVPGSVSTITAGAFSGNSYLKSVVLPESLTYMDEEVFENCTQLTSITIPRNCTWLGYFSPPAASFNGCDSLQRIEVEEGNTAFSSVDGILMDAGKTTIYAYPKGREEENYTLPGYITIVFAEAFGYCNNLVNVTIPEGITDIYESAFIGCENLTSVTIHGEIESTNRTFMNCTKLKSVVLPETLKTIGEATFWRCLELDNIVIPESVTEIGRQAFVACLGLTNIIIPSGVNTIRSSGFGSCMYLESVTIPRSITCIEEGAFSGCYILTDVYYNGTQEEWNNISIGDNNEYLTSATIHFN